MRTLPDVVVTLVLGEIRFNASRFVVLRRRGQE